jgi:hypothetical protein
LLTIYSMLVSSLKVLKADVSFGGAMKLKIENYCYNFGTRFDFSCYFYTTVLGVTLF